MSRDHSIQRLGPALRGAPPPEVAALSAAARAIEDGDKVRAIELLLALVRQFRDERVCVACLISDVHREAHQARAARATASVAGEQWGSQRSSTPTIGVGQADDAPDSARAS